MKTHNLLNSIAAAVLVTGLALTAIPSSAVAESIQNNDRINGVIRRTSPIYRFRDIWTPGAPVGQFRGQEYTFSAQQGDNIKVILDTDRGRPFSPVVVLFNENNKEVCYSQEYSFNCFIPRDGSYKLVILTKDASKASKYTLKVSGIDGGDRQARNGRDDRRDNRGDDDQSDRAQILQDDLGLRSVDCSDRRSLVRVRFDDNNQDSTYCAVPTRNFPAGDYYYNSRTRDLDSARNDDSRFDRSNDNSRFDRSNDNSRFDRPDQCRVSVGGVCVTR